jgi:hypothetical protein
MKRLLRPQTLLIGTVALALLGWSGMSASGARLGSHGTARVELVQSSHEAQKRAQEPAEQQNEVLENENEDEDVDQVEDENEEKNENPAPPTAAPTTTVTSRTFILVGGTVMFTCTNNRLSLNSAVPAAGFGVETETEDGGQEIKVRFENDAHRSEIRAECVSGQVQATRIREESR